MEFAIVAVLGILAIVAVNALAPRVGVAAPLVLMLLGVAISLLPFVPLVEVEPEWILMGVLPPLLYSASVSMPAMDFRRDFRAISGLSVLLVVITAVLLGWLFSVLIPDINLATGIALGAIVSPTDAVATSIVKRLGAPTRVVTILEGESLLNDASALVLLRSAIAATATAVSLWGVVGDFLFAVVVAVAIGGVVGILNLRARKAIRQATLNTAISFVVPFVAYVPAEELGASGLVAAVTAGLVTGWGSTRYLRPQDRLAQTENWRTIELVLEGAVFLVMGLEVVDIVTDVTESHGSVALAVGIAALTILGLVVIRAAFLAPLLRSLGRRADRAATVRAAMADNQQRWEDAAAADPERVRKVAERFGQDAYERRRARFTLAFTRRIADVDYLASARLGWREGGLLVWAGMRGVVTLAAAQTLPRDTPARSLLVLVAFLVAGGSLLVQGGTLPWLVRRLGLTSTDTTESDDERQRLQVALADAATGALDRLTTDDGGTYDAGVVAQVRLESTFGIGEETEEESAGPTSRFAQYRSLRVKVIEAQRAELLHLRAVGTYDSTALTRALEVLDADQIRLELDGEPA
ncbi:sodium/hydrogen exchanger [Beutenbergia cavernae DSM 12333]|uniref:Sodium/hydrogen exchanger n=1 Tax=Beutenbergia cavernae (strain ATCC BAA-8 / DSM 12333 / CCUG 43141 / JCM 11478 / NBRC 16432 / NCIMB 13614 / HKI 0122) TaxID=471853 RepID=C5BY05_BEUC1|nr:sodium:proton antiporter [Beutenbergia cavernae]ACQ78899.1 sodium/hydrogen exchanger [Beutenbergia cavernae DSM 12333]